VKLKDSQLEIREVETKFQLSNLLENSEIKRQPIGNQGVGNKISTFEPIRK
jgi:hypothetical protein